MYVYALTPVCIYANYCLNFWLFAYSNNCLDRASAT